MTGILSNLVTVLCNYIDQPGKSESPRPGCLLKEQFAGTWTTLVMHYMPRVKTWVRKGRCCLCTMKWRKAHIQDVLDVRADVSLRMAAAGTQDARDVRPHRTLTGCSQAQQQVPSPNICYHLSHPPDCLVWAPP